MPMLRRKRLWPLLVTTLVLGATLAAWPPQGVWAGSPQPVVGIPRHGDLALYTLEGAEGGADGAELLVKWLAPTTRVDRWGIAREADVLTLVLRNETDEVPLEVAFAADRMEPMSYAFNAAMEGTDQGAAPPFHLLRTTYEVDAGGRTYAGKFLSPLLCAFRAAWQGERVTDPAGRTLHSACPGHGGAAKLEDAGEAEVDGIAARGLRATLVNGDHAEAWTYWFVHGVPYPVTVTLDRPENSATLRLKGFEPGDGALIGKDASTLDEPSRRPGAAFGAPGRWAVVESDADALPFPASHAIAGLEENPTLTRFHAYLREHPTARVVTFEYDGGASGTAQPTWAFTFSDENGEGWRVAARLAAPAGAGEDLPAVPRAATVSSDGGESFRHEPAAPVPAGIEVLAVDAALAAWRAAHPDAPEPNLVWGALTVDPSAPGEASASLTVGRMASESRPAPERAPDVPAESTADFWFYTVDPLTGATLTDMATTLRFVTGVDALRDAAPTAWTAPPQDSAEERALAGIAAPAVAGVAALALFAYYFGDALRSAAVPLFHRLERGEVLDNPNRRALLDAVREAPGIHGHALAARVACGNGATLYHLDVLRREGYVTRVRSGGFVRYFPAGSAPPAEMRREAVLRSGSLRRLLEAVEARPGLTQAEVAKALGVSAPAVSYAVRRLEREGLVRRERDGRVARLYAAAPAPEPPGPDSP